MLKHCSLRNMTTSKFRSNSVPIEFQAKEKSPHIIITAIFPVKNVKGKRKYSQLRV